MSVLSNTGIRAGASGAAGGGDAYQIEKSLRFNEDDSAYLNRAPSSDGSTTTFTWSGWVKRTLANSGYTWFLSSKLSPHIELIYLNADRFEFYQNGSGGVTAAALLRDPSAWYHLVCAVDTTQDTDSDRVKLYINGEVVTDFYQTYYPSEDHVMGINKDTNDLKLGKYTTTCRSNYQLAEVHYIDGQQLTASDFGETNEDTGQWVPKKYSGSYGTNGFYLKFNGTDLGEDSSGNDNDFTANNLTRAGYTISSPNMPTWDTVDTGWTVTNSNRHASTGPTGISNYQHVITGNLALDTTYHFFLSRDDSTTEPFLGGWFLTDSAGDAEDTVPNEYTSGNSLGHRAGNSTVGTYGTYATVNGTSNSTGQLSNFPTTQKTDFEFVINRTVDKVWMRVVGEVTWRGLGDPSNTSSTATFSIPDGANMVFGYVGYNDSSTTANITDTASDPSDVDVSTDTPTPFDDEGNGTGNYCTWNPLCITTTANSLSEGNLKATHAASTAWTGGLGTNGATFSGTIGMTSGKWYFEMNSDGGANLPVFGITNKLDGSNYVGIAGNGIGIVSTAIYNSDFQAPSTPSVGTLADGDIIGIAVDMDNGFVWFSINGTWQNSGDPTDTDGASNGCCGDGFVGETMFPACSQVGRDHAIIVTANFGQRAFAYTPPTGFKALNTFNLDAPTIDDPSKHFDVSIWTGDDAASRDIDGLNFQPDMVWGKNRDGNNHQLFDAIREAGSTKELTPSQNFNEGRIADPNTPVYGWLSAFNSDGFTVAEGSSASDGNFYWNESSSDHVAWSWNAGGTNFFNDVSETSIGTIDSTYRANPSAGFSIVSYTGTGAVGTIAHGLNAKIDFAIFKNREDTRNWAVYHKEMGNNHYTMLDDGGQTVIDDVNAWNDTGPTSSIMTLGDLGAVNASTEGIIAYCWSEVEGYSKFGTWTGNQDTDGPFVWCGFKPAYILFKCSSHGEEWIILDNKRDTYNEVEKGIYGSLSNAEDSGGFVDTDFLSNGFKLRADGSIINGPSKSYIFAAFAESPFKYSNAR